MGLISGIPSTSRARVMKTPVAVGRVGDARASGGALTAVPAQAPLKSSHAVTASIRTALEGDSGRNPDADDGVPGSSSGGGDELLFHSLYRKHPVGGLLVWATKASTPHRGDGSIAPGIVKLLLDGQQRMTALYGVARGRPPKFFDGDPRRITGLRFHLEEETFEFYQQAKNARRSAVGGRQ